MSMEVLETPREEQRVLITGATGFLGKYAVAEFARHGYQVTATGRNPATLRAIERPGLETLQASIDELSNTEIPTDIIIHAAALSSPWGAWEDFHRNNVEATKKMIAFAGRSKANKFVYVSSPSIYSGFEHRYDIAEDSFDPKNNLNNYIRSKILAEAALKGAYDDGDIPDLAILRPRGLIGIGDTSLVPRLIEANEKFGIPLFNHGENVVDITCVENAALALRLAAEAPNTNGRAYNITNGEPRTFRSITDELFEAIGQTPKYKNLPFKAAYIGAGLLEKIFNLGKTGIEPPITRYMVTTLGFSQTLDITRARTELGYEPKNTLSQGIENFAAHFRNANEPA